MPLPPSGPISFSQLQAEFGGSNPISLSEYYEGGSYVQADVQGTIPTAGTIDISDFYGGQAMNPNLRGLINFDSIPPASGSGYTNSVINIADPYDGQNWSIYSGSPLNSSFFDVVGAFGAGKGIAATSDSGVSMTVSRPLSNISSNLFTLDFHIHSDDYSNEESGISIAINSNSTGNAANGAHFNFGWDVGGGLAYNAYFGTSFNRPYISAMPVGWSHIRICYNGSTVFTFVNGTLRDSFSYAGNTLLRSPGGYLVFNAYAYWYGYSAGSGVGYDNIRLLHGVCLSTSNFTPPTAQWTVTE